MDDLVAEKLEVANKLIFVKQYSEAERQLDAILETEAGNAELLVHVRRIELAAMLQKLEGLRNEYVERIRRREAVMESEICLALADQHEEAVSPAEAISTYQGILGRHGPSAAVYYGLGLAMEMQGNLERALYNYEESLNQDSGWYLSYFGMSQIHYQLGDEDKGDHFFYLFEQAAPYNVYGNFETHRELCREFLDEGKFSQAEAAIRALSEWWWDNKGKCPTEIQVYELMQTAHIADIQGDPAQAENQRTRAKGIALEALENNQTSEGVLYFVAKVFEEFGELSTAIQCYKKLLRREGTNPAVIQKIGSQFLSSGEYELAAQLFEEAYHVHPEHQDIRFCLLVSRLKTSGVNVEEYLIGRERLRQLLDSDGDRVELLSLLHSLMAKFDRDPDVQGHVADVYLRLGNVDRSERHYRRMYDLDKANRSAALKYAAFVMQYRDPEEAMAVLDGIRFDETLSTDDQAEIYWLQSNYYARRGDYSKSNEILSKVLAIDPWSISYLVQEIVNLTNKVRLEDEDLQTVDAVLAKLDSSEEEGIDWSEYDQKTERLERENHWELAYARRKLRFLYDNGSRASLLRLVHAACRHNPERGTYDFIRLLNTNFDGPEIYWALGMMYQELWQLETASVWLNQALMHPGLTQEQQSRIYVELADCYVWQGRELTKATEYSRVAMDMETGGQKKSMRVLAHALLKSGKVREARQYLEQLDTEEDPEVRYLNGLLKYRNGAVQEANETWKPLLTTRTQSLRVYHIKQNVLRYYFDGEPYLKAN